jgi:CubicO group peptidase (beta-lactamase class C family)
MDAYWFYRPGHTEQAISSGGHRVGLTSKYWAACGLVGSLVFTTGASADAAPADNLARGACPVLHVGSQDMQTVKFAALDEEIARGVGTLYAGAVLAISYNGEVLHTAAFGNAQTLSVDNAGKLRKLSRPRSMTVDTIFDMASVTKVEATTAAIMHLVGSGRLGLDDQLGQLLPEFKHTDKAEITVRQLLTHRAGLWEWQPSWLHRDAKGKVLPYLVALPLRYPIGSRSAYSDLGFMLLGEIVSRVSGEPLDRYVKQEIYTPLGMKDTGFLPSPALRKRIAATSQGDTYQRQMAETGKPYPSAPFPPSQPFSGYRRNILVGQANDANAWLGWNGVAGHAGLFSSALDISRYAQALINGGCYGNWRLAPADTVVQFEQTPFDAEQALGFHKWSVPGVTGPFYGHAGFTGTWFAFSPELGLSVVLLTNRVHRDESDGAGYPSVNELRDTALREAVKAVKP